MWRFIVLCMVCLCSSSIALKEVTETKGLSKPFINRMIERAIQDGQNRLTQYKKEIRRFKEKGIDKSGKKSRDELNWVMKKKRDADKMALDGFLSLETTRALSRRLRLTVEKMTSNKNIVKAFERKFCPKEEKTNCKKERRSPYRTDNGRCNNIKNPDWGAALTSQPRYLPAAYDNGISSPREFGVDGHLLPSPRLISNKVFKGKGTSGDNAAATTKTDRKESLMVMVWGQFLDHDLVATPVTTGDGVPLTCCGEEVINRTGCFPIFIPNDDAFFTDTDCMDFARSATSPPEKGCGLGVREQMNQITSFIDGGAVYGDSRRMFRTLSNSTGVEGTKRMPIEGLDDKQQITVVFAGEMYTSEGDLLPPGGNCKLSDPDDFCQIAGDHRVNVVPSLGGIHLVFVRHHNRIVEKLREVRPNWRGTRLFQETRKIIGALMQQISYGEYLPTILSKDAMSRYGLRLKSRGYLTDYDSTVNPAVRNVFAAAAFRFGHSQIPPSMAYLLHDYTTLQAVPIDDTFFDPHMLVTQNGARVSDLARFVATSQGMKSDGQFEDSVRNRLFKDDDGHSFDLPSLNIQRGRDHGLPSYNKWRLWCNLPVAESFKDLQDMNRQTRKVLSRLYSNVEDIDVFVGGMIENPLPGGSVGPLFSCIIGRQFRDLRVGDRYWYESRGDTGFTKDQLKEIRKMKLSKVFCQTMELDQIQEDIFHIPSDKNPLVSCVDLPDMDFSAWAPPTHITKPKINGEKSFESSEDIDENPYD